MGCYGLLGASLAGYEDADAFDHLGCRACTLGEEGVCVAGAVEGVDGAGDDHRGKPRMELLGAADEFIAVHLGHDEVAEEQVDAAGYCAGDYLEGFVRGLSAEDAIAAGFEQEGSDREDLFVVINAENSFLGAHAYSVLPQTAF